jgi:hypothetical protein
MIIGINGKIGSGKDTVGKIIQYLLCNNTGGIELEDIASSNDHDWWLEEQSGFDNKKFAGKLKEIASMLTGIPVENFEDQEFKKNLLGPEWGTVKDIPLNAISPFADMQFNVMMSVREFLQKLGTEAMRDGLHTNVWVNALFADYHPTPNKSMEESFKEQLVTGSSQIHYKLPNWIITDMRFPNEMEAIEERGGITIRVNREFVTSILPDGQKLSVERGILTGEEHLQLEKPHPSETALDDHEFDYEIVNEGTIKELAEKVQIILIKEGIL